jgi:hypothetical protein
MTTQSPLSPDTIECPLCSGAGKVKRTELLDRLGVKGFARSAQLSAEEAFRLLQNRHNHEHQSTRARLETGLAKRTAEIRERYKGELRITQSVRDTHHSPSRALVERSRSASSKKPEIGRRDVESRPHR